MKFYQFLGVFIAGLRGLYAVDVDGPAPVSLDYHHRNIHFGNISEKSEELERNLQAGRDSPFSLNLSDNSLDDSCLDTLLGTLTADGYADLLEVLDLSNNRISGEGLKTLAPLIVKRTFKWLVIPTNSLDTSDMATLRQHLRPFAQHHVSTTSVGASSDEIVSEWMAKVIWLPGTYNFDSLPLSPRSRDAHKAYYRVTD